ncbi:MAG TPA: HAD-IIB family hydrolase, partial [Cytophagaceae bacterium]|nr:HAD-IIB family hydrolase [Cytophagaceae bacterium]
MYKAVFIDIDGTLIRSDHSVSEETVDTIQKLKEKNILVVLVSARPLHGMLSVSEQVKLQEAPLASLNGSYISLCNKIIFESFIDATLTANLQKQLIQYKTTLIYYQQMQWFAEAANIQTDKEQKITSIPVTIQSFADTLKYWQEMHSGPNKILAVADENTIQTIQETLVPFCSDQLNMYTSKPIYLEFMNKEASKLNAVKFLANRYHIKKEEIIAIGDNFN